MAMRAHAPVSSSSPSTTHELIITHLQHHAHDLRRVSLREVPLLQNEVKELAAQARLLRRAGGRKARAQELRSWLGQLPTICACRRSALQL